MAHLFFLIQPSLSNFAFSDQSIVFLCVVLVILMIISFSISGTQAAVFSLDDKQISVLKTKQQSSARRIIYFLSDSKVVYTSMLLGKIIANICIIVLTNSIINTYLPLQSNLLIVSKFLLIAFFIILFIEILPRIWATQNNTRFIYEWPFLTKLVELNHLLFKRISFGILSFSISIARGVGANNAEAANEDILNEEIDVADATASPEEKSILKSIIKFNKITVKNIMNSRVYVKGINFDYDFSTVIEKIKEFQYSRLPVYKNSMDEIVGMLYTKDLIPYIYHTDPNFKWQDKIRTTFFVPETKLIQDLLNDFQSNRKKFAVVVDEFGGTSGIITLEDIMEEVTGDIKDEFDSDEYFVKKEDENNYIFEGHTKIHDMCKALALPIDYFDTVRGGSETIGGLILEVMGVFPNNGDIVRAKDYEFTVKDIVKNKINLIKITKKYD